ncbi:MAG: HAMP domain-containing sensor histidine kinase [candidate division Zixibacteria bacterium]
MTHKIPKQTEFNWKNSLNLVLLILTPLILFFVSVMIYHNDIDSARKSNFTGKWNDVISLLSARAAIVMDENYSIDDKFASDLYLLPSFLDEIEFIILVDQQNRPILSVGEETGEDRLLADIGMTALSGKRSLLLSDKTTLDCALFYSPVIRDKQVLAAVIMGVDEEKPLYAFKSTLISSAAKSAIPFAIWVAAVIIVSHRKRRKAEFNRNYRRTELRLLSMGFDRNDAGRLGEESLELIVNTLGLNDGLIFIKDKSSGEFTPYGRFSAKLDQEVVINNAFEPADPRLVAMNEKQPKIYGLSGTGRARSIEQSDKSYNNRRIAIPLAVGDVVFGLLDLGVNISTKLSVEFLELCKRLGDRLAVSLSDLLEYSETRNQLIEFRKILETVEIVDSSPELPVALSEVTRHITETKNVRFCRVFTMDEGGINLVLAAETWAGEGTIADSVGAAHILDDMPIHKVAILSGQSQILRPDDIEKQFETQKDIYRREMISCIILIIPLSLGDRQLGCLSVAIDSVDEFPVDLRTRLERLTRFLAASVSRAQLCMRLKRAYDKLNASQSRTMQSERLAAITNLADGISETIGETVAYLRDKISRLGEEAGTSSRESIIKDVNFGMDNFSDIINRFNLFTEIDKSDHFQPIELAQLITESQDVLNDMLKRAEANEKNIDLRITISGSGQIYGDKENLKSMVKELAKNSMEAISDKGEIVIETRVELNQAVLEIKDTGRGISDDIKNKVFEPFFTTREGYGRGLGLSMAYGIVASHNGSIDIADESSGGTTIIVHIPLIDPEQTALYSIRKGTSRSIPLSSS